MVFFTILAWCFGVLWLVANYLGWFAVVPKVKKGSTS